jgi:hypothetical protein
MQTVSKTGVGFFFLTSDFWGHSHSTKAKHKYLFIYFIEDNSDSDELLAGI